jgi:hypothetical protein
MQGAGSPTAMKIMIGRETNIERKKELAKVIAGIEEDPYFQGITGMKEEQYFALRPKEGTVKGKSKRGKK